MTAAYYYPALQRRLDRVERLLQANNPPPDVAIYWDTGEGVEVFGPDLEETLTYEEAAALFDNDPSLHFDPEAEPPP